MGWELFPQVPRAFGQEPIGNDRLLVQCRRLRRVQRKFSEPMEDRGPDFACIAWIREDAQPACFRSRRAHEGFPPSGGRMICNSASSLGGILIHKSRKSLMVIPLKVRLA